MQVPLCKDESVLGVGSLAQFVQQPRVLDGDDGLSALPPKADIAEHEEHVRFLPKADISHLIGAAEAARHAGRMASRMCRGAIGI